MKREVAPFAGARIEIYRRGRGRSDRGVAPFAGARIEIKMHIHNSTCHSVAPFAGARIEIKDGTQGAGTCQSLPSRERGLKSGTGSCRKNEIRRSLRGSAD